MGEFDGFPLGELVLEGFHTSSLGELVLGELDRSPLGELVVGVGGLCLHLNECPFKRT